MRPTTWAIICFILIEVLLFGGMAYCLWIGQKIVALVLLLPAFMLRVSAMNDGPGGDGAAVWLSLLDRYYLPPNK